MLIRFIFFLKIDIEELKDAQSVANTSDTHRIEGLERQLNEKDVLIEQLLDQIQQMKSSFQAWVDCTETTDKMPPTVNGDDGNGSRIEERSTVAKIPVQDDESYFMTYDHFNIHYDMLSVSMGDGR